MKVSKTELLLFLITLSAFVIGILFYPFLPETLASHWNINGEVDGNMGKFWGVFLLPVISVFLSTLFIVAPKVDPHKEAFEDFRSEYDKFVIYLSSFFLGLYLITLLWTIDFKVPINIYISLGLAGLLYNLSLAMETLKKNWFIGIRTAWTLSSDRVWKSTHKLGAKLFKFSSIFVLLGVFSPKLMLIAISPLFISALFLVVFSYFEFKKGK